MLATGRAELGPGQAGRPRQGAGMSVIRDPIALCFRVSIFGLAVGVATLLSIGALVGVDCNFAPEATIPDPGRIPVVADSTLRYEPAHMVPRTIAPEVRRVDYARFVATLQRDILLHGGWIESPRGAGSRGRTSFEAVVPENYLARLRPLMADAEGPHPNYQSWARKAVDRPVPMQSSSSSVQVKFRIHRGYFYNPVNSQVCKVIAIVLGAAFAVAVAGCLCAAIGGLAGSPDKDATRGWTVKALTLHQPRATLTASRVKTI